MKAISRYLLICLTIFVFLWNYQIYSFSYGFVSLSNTGQNNEIWQEISFYASVEEIDYYNTIGLSTVVVFKSKSEKTRIYKIGEGDLEAIKALAKSVNLLTNSIKIRQITVIPWFIYIFIILLLLFVPLNKKS